MSADNDNVYTVYLCTPTTPTATVVWVDLCLTEVTVAPLHTQGRRQLLATQSNLTTSIANQNILVVRREATSSWIFIQYFVILYHNPVLPSLILSRIKLCALVYVPSMCSPTCGALRSLSPLRFWKGEMKVQAGGQDESGNDMQMKRTRCAHNVGECVSTDVTPVCRGYGEGREWLVSR